MTAFVLLLISGAAQVLIAAGLGIYFAREYLKKREGKKPPPTAGIQDSAPSPLGEADVHSSF